MKSVLALITILGLFTVSQAVHLSHQETVTVHYGESSDWKDDPKDAYSVQVDIDLSDLNLKNAPFVQTFVTCSRTCWLIGGASSIYDLTNKGFRVYLHLPEDWTAAQVKANNYVLHYRIEEQQA